MPITHKWNGTVLTITSDSGSSSMDLKGEKGDDGARGAQGARGERGGGALINDYTISKDEVWSSSGIMDRFAEAMCYEGNPVICNPLPNMPLDIITNIKVKQEGSGKPVIPGCGKNLVNPPVPMSYSLQEFGYDEKTGTISIVKAEGSGKNQLMFELDADVSACAGKNITLSYQDYSITNEGDSQRIYLSTADGTTIATIWPNTDTYKSLTRVIPEGTKKVRILIRIDQNNTLPIGTELTIKGLQVEISDAATEFEPYSNIRPIIGMNAVNVVRNGETYTMELGQTVYNGSIDWNRGIMMVDWVYTEINGTENFRMDTSGYWACANGNSFYCDTLFNSIENSIPISNMYSGVKRSNTNEFTHNTLCIAAGGTQIEFIQTNYSTIEDWKAYLAAQYAAGKPIQVCYQLAEPQEYKLTPQLIRAINGTNTLYTDADNIQVFGRVDTMATIKALADRVAALEAAAGGE